MKRSFAPCSSRSWPWSRSGAPCRRHPDPHPEPELCQPGTFSATGEELHTPAPIGTFVDTEGAHRDTVPPRDVPDEAGQTSCKVAPIGTYVENFGAASHRVLTTPPPSPAQRLHQHRRLRAGAVSIDAGSYHLCAVLADGTARCWGSNQFGQLGDGTTTSSSVPVDVAGLSGAVDISAGIHRSCALLADGTARCWGSQLRRRARRRHHDQPVHPGGRAGLRNAVAISAGVSDIWNGMHSCCSATAPSPAGVPTTTGSWATAPPPARVCQWLFRAWTTWSTSPPAKTTCAVLADAPPAGLPGFLGCWRRHYRRLGRQLE